MNPREIAVNFADDPHTRRARAVHTLNRVLVVAILLQLIPGMKRSFSRDQLRDLSPPAPILISPQNDSVARLRLLPGIGRARAEAIVAWRKAHGPVKDMTDFRAASGISKRQLEALRSSPGIRLAWPSVTGPGTLHR